MGFVQRQLVKMVMRVVSYPRVTVAICAVLLVVSIVFARVFLTLSTDQNALLTPNLPFFKDYLTFDAKFPENEAFVVLVQAKDDAHSSAPGSAGGSIGHTPTAKRWMALADQISSELMKLKGVVKRVDSRVPLDELGDQGLLFEDDFDSVKEQTAEITRMVPLLNIMAGQPGVMNPGEFAAQRLFGPNMMARFYGAVGQGTMEEGKDFGVYITQSLNAALSKPPEQWKKGGSDTALRGGEGAGSEIPDLTDLDPASKYDASQYGYYMIPDETKRNVGGGAKRRNEKIMAISVYGERDYTSLADVTEPLEKMRAAVGRVAAGFPEFSVEFTGRPVLEADEMATSDRDVRIAEICGLSLVFIMMWLFLRHIWLVLAAEICLGTAIGWTFGWATLAVGRLNLLSMVFVIALIGIGMDYLIQILMRYRFEKKRYVRPQAVWARVFRHISPPISTACLGAAGAFFVANLTDFKGAGELGVIAGGGLLLCLASGYTLLPALLTIWPANVGRVAETERYQPEARSLKPEARRIPAKAGAIWWWVVPVLWVVVAVVGVVWVGMPRFDPNLLTLQAAELPSVKLVHKLPTWTAAVMTDDLAKLRAASEALAPEGKGNHGGDGTIRSASSILNAIDTQAWLAKNNVAVAAIKWKEPGEVTAKDLADIARAADAMVANWASEMSHRQTQTGTDRGMEELREQVKLLTEKLRAVEGREEVRSRLEQWQRAFYRELREKAGMFTPGPLDLERVPAEVRDHFVSYRDNAGHITEELKKGGGRPTYAMYIYPREDLWEQGKLTAFMEEVEARTPKNVVLTGIAVQLPQSTRAIHRAFLLSTLYAVILIFVLVLLDLRRLGQTLLAISVLVFGLPMLIVAMAVWRWAEDPMGIPGTWNFANFFALPILIGAGHEYGVFLVHRYREVLHDPRRVWKWWDASDRALLLCAIVTSCSFGFLMGAQHRGLASLGWVMAVGSACIYLAGLLVLRPILQWLLRRNSKFE